MSKRSSLSSPFKLSTPLALLSLSVLALLASVGLSQQSGWSAWTLALVALATTPWAMAAALRQAGE